MAVMYRDKSATVTNKPSYGSSSKIREELKIQFNPYRYGFDYADKTVPNAFYLNGYAKIKSGWYKITDPMLFGEFMSNLLGNPHN